MTLLYYARKNSQTWCNCHEIMPIVLDINAPLAAVGVTEQERCKIIKRSRIIKVLFYLCLHYNQYYIGIRASNF